MISIFKFPVEAIKKKTDRYKQKLENGNPKNKVQQQMADLEEMHATVLMGK